MSAENAGQASGEGGVIWAIEEPLAYLLKRVEAADGPSRELDGAVALNLAGASRYRNWYDDEARTVHAWHVMWKWTPHAKWEPLPHYTSDLGETVKLVERLLPTAGWELKNKFGNCEGKPFPPSANIAIPFDGEFGNTYLKRGDANGKTPTLALIAALVKAKLESHG